MNVKHEWDMSHVNESCRTWMRHVTHEWIMLHMTESCQCEWVISYINETCRIWMRHVTREKVTSCMNHSCRISHATFELVMSRMSQVTEFMSHIWLGKCMSSCHIYECVRAFLRCEWDISYVWMRKQQRRCLRHVPAKQWGMTPMSPCVDTQCIAVCCSALQCVAVCCGVLRCVAVFCNVWWRPWMKEQRRDNPHVMMIAFIITLGEII